MFIKHFCHFIDFSINFLSYLTYFTNFIEKFLFSHHIYYEGTFHSHENGSMELGNYFVTLNIILQRVGKFVAFLYYEILSKFL